MKRLQTEEKRVLIANDSSPFSYFAWPTIARLPDGTLAIAASGLRMGHHCPFGKATISYSRDEGKTWTPPAIMMDTPLDDRDCGLMTFGEGRVLFATFNCALDAAKRINASLRERSLTPKEQAECDLFDAYIRYAEQLDPELLRPGSFYRISDDGGYTFGPLRRMPVSAPHGPCRLNDGGVLYVGSRLDRTGTDEPMIECWTLDENDEPRYLSSIENVKTEYGVMHSCEPHAIQLPDGKIIVLIRMESDGRHYCFNLYQSVSTDGGKTFSFPEQVTPPRGGAPAYLMMHSNGTLVCTYGYRVAPYGIRAMFSRDGGVTWDTDYILDDTGFNEDLGYPSAVELPDGSLLTVYYESVEPEKHTARRDTGYYDNAGFGSRIVGRVWRLPE